MIHTTHSIRVRYGETDPMKYVYYGNYAEYFEVARVELFRTLGISYDEIEKRGIFLPVSEYKIKYLKPGLYDQLLEIHTYIKKIPAVKIEFEYASCLISYGLSLATVLNIFSLTDLQKYSSPLETE